MATWEVKGDNEVVREVWDNVTNTVQYFNGDGSPNGEPQDLTPEQVDVLNKLIEQRNLFGAALNAYEGNNTFLGLVQAGTITTQQYLAQVVRLTEQNNAIMKLLVVDVLKLPGSRG